MSKVATWQVLSATAAVLLVSVLVVQASMAAFSGTTDTDTNWDSATVALSDDDGGTTLTTSSGMVPGDSDQACITVTYDGDTAANVKLYGSTSETSPDDLGEYLDLSIEEVTIGTGTCASPESVGSEIFASTSTLSVNTGSFAAAHNDWSDGLASNWSPAASGDTQDYRITVTLQDNNSAQGLVSTATFNWEAQNT